MVRKLLDIVFWLAVSIYFGGMAVLGAIVAPAVFATTKAKNINLPGIAPPLDATAQAGGEIFGVALQRFAYVEFAVLLILGAVIAGWIFKIKPARLSNWMLAFFWVILAGLAAYDAAFLAPQVWAMREQVRTTAAQHTGAEGAAWPEQTEFDALHKRSELIGQLKVYALLAMIIITAGRGSGRPVKTADAQTPAAPGQGRFQNPSSLPP